MPPVCSEDGPFLHDSLLLPEVPHKGSPSEAFPSQFQVPVTDVMSCCWEILLFPSTCSLSSHPFSLFISSINPELRLAFKTSQLLSSDVGERSDQCYSFPLFPICFGPLPSRSSSQIPPQSFQYFRPHQRTIKCHHLASFSRLIVPSPPENWDIFHTKTGYTLLQQPMSF